MGLPRQSFFGPGAVRQLLLPSLLRSRAVVLTLTLMEEDIPALSQGCRHGLCHSHDRIRLEIRVGLDGPSTQEEPEQASLGTDAQCTLFQTL